MASRSAIYRTVAAPYGGAQQLDSLSTLTDSKVVHSNILDRWTGRIATLRILKHGFVESQRYQRASQAEIVLQRAYERWAREMFSLKQREALRDSRS
jgi:hypothetical protein